jgi:hypothetical protein
MRDDDTMTSALAGASADGLMTTLLLVLPLFPRWHACWRCYQELQHRYIDTYISNVALEQQQSCHRGVTQALLNTAPGHDPAYDMEGAPG